MTWAFAALSLGLLGSFHCIGMCGPIAIALPVHHLNGFGKIWSILIYNLGRAFTYALLGALFGLVGQGFYLGGFQQTVSIVLGVLLLFSIGLPRIVRLPRLGYVYNGVSKLKSKLAWLFTQKGNSVLFLIGALNGLLPCGLVYIGIAGAIATSTFVKGAAFMFVFGMGTFPVMMSVVVFGQFISIRYRNVVRKIIPLAVSVMAILLVLRGLNLGIPYVSPRMEEQQVATKCAASSKNPGPTKVMKCCPKPNKASVVEEDNRAAKERAPEVSCH